MDRDKILTLGILIMLISGVILLSGCAGRRSIEKTTTTVEIPKKTETTVEKSTTTIMTTETTTTVEEKKGTMKTCSQLNGFKCSTGDECPGKWLDASDTFSCCSVKCKSPTGKEILTIGDLDFGHENEDLGDVV